MAQLRNNGIISKGEYVGKTLEEATQYANSGGFSARVVEKDGNSFILDMDFKTERLNFRIRGEMVIDVYGG
jgi:hypothetical protein